MSGNYLDFNRGANTLWSFYTRPTLAYSLSCEAPHGNSKSNLVELSNDAMMAEQGGWTNGIFWCAIITAVLTAVLSLATLASSGWALVNVCQSFGLSIAIAVMATVTLGDYEEERRTVTAVGDAVNGCGDQFMTVDVE